MFKKGMALVSMIGLVMVTNLFLVASQTQAIAPNDNGCFTFQDRQPICPDKYCLPGTASCSNDGNRCYCKTRTLVNSSQNQSCEIIFGSKMIYKTINNEHTIYLYGGLWSQVASLIPSSPHTSDINGEPAIIFKRAYGKIYRSAFLTDLYRSTIFAGNSININSPNYLNFPINSQDVMLAIEADINTTTGVGYVSNPRYEIGSNTASPLGPNGNISCAHRQAGDKPFFLKYSTVSHNPYDEDDPHNVCVFPSFILSMAIFGRDNQSWFPTPPKIALTKNCTDKRKNFFSKDNLDIHLLMANLITPQGESRKIYLMRSENFLLGENFDGVNHSIKVSRVRRVCNESDLCKIDNPAPDCRLCNSPIIDKLNSNSGTTLSQVVQEFLFKEDQAVCDLINTGADFISGATITNPSTSEPESTIEKQLPPGIINLCNSPQVSQTQRLKCKKFALKCYLNNLPEVEPISMCDQLNGQLTSSRWMICAASNTLSSASSQSGKFLDGFFRLNTSNFFNNQTFLQAWSIFRNICNILLVMIMMWIVFSQVSGVGLSNYNIKQMLPKLIIAIILINLSMILAQVAVDLSNIAGRGLFLLFDNFAQMLKISGLARVNFSSIVLSSLSSNSIFLILGGLVLLLPVLIAVVIGLLFVAIMLSLRHALIVILILTMPVAIITGILSNTQRLFQFWSKNFFNALLIYPVIGLMFGAGNFIKLLIISVAHNDSNTQIIALAMPFLLTSATPFVMLRITRGIGALNTIMQNSLTHSIKTSQHLARNSDFSQTIKANQERFWLQSDMIDRTLSNKSLNRVFLGAGNNVLRRRIQKRASMQNFYRDIIGSDTKLLNAFHASHGVIGGAAYNQLNTNQQQRYRQLASLDVLKDKFFYETSFKTIASKGGVSEDCSEINIILNNAQTHGVEAATQLSTLFVSSKIAEKAGNPFTAGVLLHAKNKLEEHYQTASMPDQSTQPRQSQSIKIDFTSDQAQDDITKQVKEVLNKVSPAKFNDNDFFHKTIDPITQERKPTLAMRGVLERIKFQPSALSNPNSPSGTMSTIDLKNEYLNAIGLNYHSIPLAIRAQLDQEIINTINLSLSYNSNLPTTFMTAEEALISAGLLTRTIGGNIK